MSLLAETRQRIGRPYSTQSTISYQTRGYYPKDAGIPQFPRKGNLVLGSQTTLHIRKGERAEAENYARYILNQDVPGTNAPPSMGAQASIAAADRFFGGGGSLGNPGIPPSDGEQGNVSLQPFVTATPVRVNRQSMDLGTRTMAQEAQGRSSYDTEAPHTMAVQTQTDAPSYLEHNSEFTMDMLRNSQLAPAGVSRRYSLSKDASIATMYESLPGKWSSSTASGSSSLKRKGKETLTRDTVPVTSSSNQIETTDNMAIPSNKLPEQDPYFKMKKTEALTKRYPNLSARAIKALELIYAYSENVTPLEYGYRSTFLAKDTPKVEIGKRRKIRYSILGTEGTPMRITTQLPTSSMNMRYSTNDIGRVMYNFVDALGLLTGDNDLDKTLQARRLDLLEVAKTELQKSTTSGKGDGNGDGKGGDVGGDNADEKKSPTDEELKRLPANQKLVRDVVKYVESEVKDIRTQFSAALTEQIKAVATAVQGEVEIWARNNNITKEALSDLKEKVNTLADAMEVNPPPAEPVSTAVSMDVETDDMKRLTTVKEEDVGQISNPYPTVPSPYNDPAYQPIDIPNYSPPVVSPFNRAPTPAAKWVTYRDPNTPQPRSNWMTLEDINKTFFRALPGEKFNIGNTRQRMLLWEQVRLRYQSFVREFQARPSNLNLTKKLIDTPRNVKLARRFLETFDTLEKRLYPNYESRLRSIQEMNNLVDKMNQVG